MPVIQVLFIASYLVLCTGIKNIGLLIPSTTSVTGIPSNASVFAAFSQALTNLSSVLHYQVSQDTKCSEGIALNETFSIKDRVDGFIGPVCEKGECSYCYVIP